MSCTNCYYDIKASKGCDAFTVRPHHWKKKIKCWNNTTPEDAEKRIIAKDEYEKDPALAAKRKREERIARQRA